MSIKRQVVYFLRLFLKILFALSKKERIVLFIATLFLIFSSWQLISGEGTVVDYKLGGLYTHGIVGEINILNPLFSDFNQADRLINDLIFVGLSKYDSETGQVRDYIADHTLSVDKLTYTFKIKEDIKWHDGEPLTADDVYFTYHDLIQDPNFPNPVLKASFKGVEIKKTAPDTITFTLLEPNSFFITNTTIGILPKHLLEDVAPADLPNYTAFNSNPIGAGPYKIQEPLQKINSQQSEVILTKFEDYFEDNAQIENVKFISYPDFAELNDALGELKGVTGVIEQYLTIFDKNPRFELHQYNLPQYMALFLNMDRELFAKSKVRLAIKYALDKKGIARIAGDHKPILSPFSLEDMDTRDIDLEAANKALDESGWKYSFADEEEAEEEVTEEGVIEEGSAEDVVETATEEAAAEEETQSVIEETIEEEVILEESQFRLNEAGEELILSLLIRTYDNNPEKEAETQAVATKIKEDLALVGIKVEVEALENAQFQAKVTAREYDLLLHGQTLGYNQDVFSFWHSSQGGSYGLNLSQYKSFEVDSLIEDTRLTFDYDKKQEKFGELEKILDERVPAIFLYTPNYYFAIDKTIKNVKIGKANFNSDLFSHFTDWVIKLKVN